MDMMLGGDNLLCDGVQAAGRERSNAWKLSACTDDGECVGGPELRWLRRNLLTVTSGIEGHPDEEWGHHVPNRRRMEKWKEDRARTSQQEDHCWVEEQAPVEWEAEMTGRHCREGQRFDKKRRNAQRVQWACQKR